MTLYDKFGEVPFSILDSRKRRWKDKKSEWLSMGINSSVGRGDSKSITENGKSDSKFGTEKYNEGFSESDKRAMGCYGAFGDTVLDRASGRVATSVFDPVLAELMIKWFCPKGGKILDPFAGGSVRGIVAKYLGLNYTGIELNPKQVDANIKQANGLFKDDIPKWIVGDSNKVLDDMTENFDFVFSCPPYYDLEIYTDLPGELSAIPTYEKFIKIYSEIIYKTSARLKTNRFAVFVVSDIRDTKTGFYRSFVEDTITAFRLANMKLYNHAIFITPAGSLPVRTGIQFNSARKLGRCHQNILIFYGGNPDKIKNNFEQFEITEPKTLENDNLW